MGRHLFSIVSSFACGVSAAWILTGHYLPWWAVGAVGMSSFVAGMLEGLHVAESEHRVVQRGPQP